MTDNPSSWYQAGVADREAGNTVPAMTKEDFFREIEDPQVAHRCAKAYERGFTHDRG